MDRYLEDQEAGSVQPLSAYLALFPGDAPGITARYLEFEAGHSVPGAYPVPEEDSETEGSLGPYQLLEEIGRGGQGVVYLAEDTRLGRKVALKVLRGLGPGSESLLLRFKREAAVAAKLEHPGICAVHEAGMIKGVPYIDMQYVEGESLSQKLTTARASDTPDLSTYMGLEDQAGEEQLSPQGSMGSDSATPKSRADLMRVVEIMEKTARAIHAAHEAGILHRDVKPGNVMVTSNGEPVVLDFGLARDDDSDIPTLTQSGDLMGTPAYMSPEQLARHSIRLDRRTDIWSLGVMLYECLTLKRPFEAPTREAVYQAIMTKDPPDVLRPNPSVPDDLRTVLDKALEKDRDRRYETALELAEELRRIRQYEPIHARPITRWIKVKRWAQRNPGVAVSLFGLLLSLSAGLAITFWLLEVATTERNEKDSALREKLRALAEVHAEKKAKEQALETTKRERDAKSVAMKETESLRLADKATEELDRNPELALLLAMQAAHTDRNPDTDRMLEQALGAKIPEYCLFGHSAPVFTIAYSPDGRQLITGCMNQEVAVWETDSGKAASFHSVDEDRLVGVCFSTGGKHELITIDSNSMPHLAPYYLGTVVSAGARYESENSTFRTAVRGYFAIEKRGINRSIWPLAVKYEMYWPEYWMSQDQRFCISLTREALLLHDLKNSRTATLSELGPGVQANATRFSKDGHLLLVARDDRSEVAIVDTENAQVVQTIHTERPQSEHQAAFNPAATCLATTRGLGGIRIYSLKDKSTLGDLDFGQDTLTAKAIEWITESRLLVATERGVDLWDVNGKRLLTTFKDTSAHVRYGVKFPVLSPDGKWLIVPEGEQVRICYAMSGKTRALLKQSAGRAEHIIVDKYKIAIAYGDGSTRVWEYPSGELLDVLMAGNDSVTALAFSPSGNEIATGCKSGIIRLWGVSQRRYFKGATVVYLDSKVRHSADQKWRAWPARSQIELIRRDNSKKRLGGTMPSVVSSCEFSPSCQYLALGCADGSLYRVTLDADVWQPELLWQADGSIIEISFSSRSDLLYLRTKRGRTTVCDLGEGQIVGELLHPGTVISRAGWCPDGLRIVTAGELGGMRIWSAAAAKLKHAKKHKEGSVLSVAGGESGTYVLSQSSESAMRLWDLEKGETISTVKLGGFEVADARFSPDGMTIAAIDKNATLRLWSLDGRLLAERSSQGRFRFKGQPHVSFSRDGSLCNGHVVDFLRIAAKRKPRDLSLSERMVCRLNTREEIGAASELLDMHLMNKRLREHLESDPLLDEGMRRTLEQEMLCRPQRPYLLAHMSWKIASLAEQKTKQYRRAKRLADAACTLAPDDPACNSALGTASYRLGDFDGAIRAFEKSLRSGRDKLPHGQHVCDLALLAAALQKLSKT
ncbi:MAG: protein kinase domain-containing protein, partial [Planctomycetota bacterium]